MEQRAVNKFNAKLGRSASETYILMKRVYGTLCLSKPNVFIWHKRFSDGRNTLEDDKHTGRPSSSKTPEKVLHINKETIRTILHEDLGKTKVCAKFVPHTLTGEQKSLRIAHCRNIISAYENDSNFLKSIDMVDTLKEDAPSYTRPMKGRRYATPDEIKTASKEYLKKILKNDFLKCLEDWTNRWHKYIISHGDYLEGDKIVAFKLERTSTEDEHRPGRPVESVTQENIDKIHDLVMLDRRMTVRQIEETLGIPKTTVDRIMREHLGLRKLSSRWVHKLLTPDQKAVRRKLSSDNLALFEVNPDEFVNRFVTMEETWAHHFTPESKQQSMKWRHSGSPPPRKAKTVPSAGKVMVSVFWDSEGVLLLDFLNKGQTITGNYYANLVKQLREAIKEKRRGMLSRKIVYHQDNAPSHRSLQAMAAIYDSGFELLPRAPYSPDLAPSDFHLYFLI
ncbi:hypothetical protein LAZ67_17001076 [Cordylochernes scorpioides]|uniref:Transposase n=1 Tax=Cordylochernes scorpioides TaxID=51811 RepID=A0ABY6LD72_9ARAC|nr:hypothetical protein LAZ67_17001076 [Cordylochernes scorpioides]